MDLQARARFLYRRDPPGQNDWVNHADDVLAGQAWTGNCGDLVSTTLELLARAGAPLTNLYRVEVGANGAPAVDHLIGCAWDEADVCWIIGDTFGEAYPAADCPHRAFGYQRLDDVVTVRAGAPWA